ncbi:MAG: tetratricopeptide repeat protein, partial [Candidatus Scalindua sp.]
MRKQLSIFCLALTTACITLTTGYAHEGTELSSKDLASQIGKTETELKEIDKKIIAYNETIKSNPDDVDAHFNLGILYEQKMKFNDAITEYQKTIQLKPDFIKARINLSLVYTERNMYGESVNELKQVLKIDPENVDAHKYIGRSYYKTGLLNEALEE